MVTLESTTNKLKHQLTRLTPGCSYTTRFALNLARINLSKSLAVLDIPSGKGLKTFELARLLPNADIIACDSNKGHLRFINQKKLNMQKNRIHTLHTDFKKLPFADGVLDLIWSEDPVPGFTFSESLAQWKDILAKNGVVIAARLSWITDERPDELDTFWSSEYSDIDTISGNIKTIEEAGYELMGQLMFPRHAWKENYYEPFIENSLSFLRNNHGNDDAVNFINKVFKEMNTYNKYNGYYNYVYYIMKKA